MLQLVLRVSTSQQIAMQHREIFQKQVPVAFQTAKFHSECATRQSYSSSLELGFCIASFIFGYVLMLCFELQFVGFILTTGLVQLKC